MKLFWAYFEVELVHHQQLDEKPKETERHQH
jgi:hypothetical protein